MELIDIAALIGAAAWAPQIITWTYRFFTKPELTLHLHTEPQIGYTSFGPLFNVSFALLCEKKDIILDKLSVDIKHENGALYNFDWAGLSEELSEIHNPIGGLPVSIKKSSLPLVIKVLHTGVAQIFVRFQRRQFRKNTKETFTAAIDKFNLMKMSGKLDTEEQINNLVLEKEYVDVMNIFNSEFIWIAGKYVVTFNFHSPHKFKYKQREYSFRLSQNDVDNLKKNIDNIKLDLIQTAKSGIIPDYKPVEIKWMWSHPELHRDDIHSIL